MDIGIVDETVDSVMQVLRECIRTGRYTDGDIINLRDETLFEALSETEVTQVQSRLNGYKGVAIPGSGTLPPLPKYCFKLYRVVGTVKHRHAAELVLYTSHYIT